MLRLTHFIFNRFTSPWLTYKVAQMFIISLLPPGGIAIVVFVGWMVGWFVNVVRGRISRKQLELQTRLQMSTYTGNDT